jgi:membrane peptidoglycan carboxypeptidase
VIKEVTDRNHKKKTIVEKGVRAVSESVAGDATYAMSKVVESGTGTRAQLDDRESAGKTGTTDKGASVWYNGYVPQVSTSVAIFHGSAGKKQHDALVIPGYTSYGGSAPATIWHDYMTEAVKNLPVKDFPDPSEDVYTGYNDHGDDTSSRPTDEQPTDPSTGQPTTPPTGEPTTAPSPTDAPTPDPEPSQTADPGQDDGGQGNGDGDDAPDENPDPNTKNDDKPVRTQETSVKTTLPRNDWLSGN